MIKYGAQEIISTANYEITDASIEQILDHSLKRTEQLQESLSKIEDKFNLNSVSLTGDEPENARQSTLYTFEGTDYKKKDEGDNALADFIDIGPRRERQQQNYNIDQYYRAALVQKPKSDTVQHVRRQVKGWRLFANGGYDHQFYDTKELDNLDKKETDWQNYLKEEVGTKPEEFTVEDEEQR